jgi:hypothetical protein
VWNDKGRSSPGSVLAGVEACCSEGVGDEGHEGADDVVVLLASSTVADAPSEGGCNDVEVVLLASSGFTDASAARASRKWGGNSRSRKWGGNSRSRASARLRIPAAARGLKKNLGWTWASKTSDNEDATAPLGHSEVLSVEESPDCASPRPSDHTCATPSGGGNRDICAHEGAQDRCEVQTVVGGQSPRHVLPDRPFDPELVADAHVVPEQPRPFAVKSGSLAGDAEVLARGAADEDIRAL